jgi:hypothetical protein
MEPDIGNVSSSYIKNNVDFKFIENYHSVNYIPSAVSAVVNNDYTYSGEIELALKCKSCFCKIEDINKESERNVSCSLTVTKESFEDSQTLSFEEDGLVSGEMELSVENDKSCKELNETKE